MDEILDTTESNISRQELDLGLVVHTMCVNSVTQHLHVSQFAILYTLGKRIESTCSRKYMFVRKC